jgi:uncharacterized repeat protein (TIGR03803 family)
MRMNLKPYLEVLLLAGTASVAMGQYTINTLASFNAADNGGYNADGELILSGDTLYGATSAGGTNNDGTVFSISLPEPGSMSLLAIVGLGLLRRRRPSHWKKLIQRRASYERF